jgi:uncharacterized protein YbaR (Trm112 family)
MDWDATHSTADGHSHSCDYCGAEIEVTYTKQAGHNEREEYYCPECDKQFFVRASLPIMLQNVRLKSARIDGKNDRYQNPDL